MIPADGFTAATFRRDVEQTPGQDIVRARVVAVNTNPADTVVLAFDSRTGVSDKVFTRTARAPGIEVGEVVLARQLPSGRWVCITEDAAPSPMFDSSRQSATGIGWSSSVATGSVTYVSGSDVVYTPPASWNTYDAIVSSYAQGRMTALDWAIIRVRSDVNGSNGINTELPWDNPDSTASRDMLAPAIPSQVTGVSGNLTVTLAARVTAIDTSATVFIDEHRVVVQAYRVS